MRPVILFIAALALAGCKPSEVFGPDSRKEELLGADRADSRIGLPAPDRLTYPSGEWDDGLGNVWRTRIAYDALVAELNYGFTAPLTMLGTIQYETMSYEIGFPDDAPIARGQARIIDAGHAVFETYNIDGTLNAHGLLHFDHPSNAPTGQPVDLRPQTDRPGTEIKGD
tara:strand:- start:11442 stop:11948 length:507 start_codon:yes stop_codon:yes gene_type:complete